MKTRKNRTFFDGTRQRTTQLRLGEKKGFFVITTFLLALILVATLFMGMKADESPNRAALGTSGGSEAVTISIEKPIGWKTKDTAIKIMVENTLKIDKVEAKTGSSGSYTDITDDMTTIQGSSERGTLRTAYLRISENCTVYIQVTDKSGKVYTKSRYLEIFDREAPTVKATISNNLLRIEASDELSGVASVYVDDEVYTDLANDTLDIRVSKLGRKYAEITIQAVDRAGNKSKVVTLKNPNFKDNSDTKSLNEQAIATAELPSGTATTTPTGEQNGTTTGTNITAPTSTQSTQIPTGGTDTSATGGETSSSTDSGSGASSDAPLFGTFEDTQKQFMSIVTKDGAVYYLIIDHDKPTENVYLLSEVTNAELERFTPQTELTEETEEYPEYIGEKPKEEEVSFIEDTPQDTTEESPNDTVTNEKKEEVPTETQKSGSPGTSIFIILIILGIGGAGFYFKIYKPKKELESADDLDDFEFEEDTDDFFSDDDFDSDTDNDDIPLEE